MSMLSLLAWITVATTLYAQTPNCSINAGGNLVICGTTTTLAATTTGSLGTGNPTWTLVSKPAGAANPTIVTPNGLSTNVTGLNSPGNYVFQVAYTCQNGQQATSTVTIAAPGDASAFTAGPDINNVTAGVGTVTFSGAVIPAGYTAQWTYYNIFKREFYNQTVTENATMTNATTATPTLTLTNKTNHTVDPGYMAVLKITSTVNPLCTYTDERKVLFQPNPSLVVNSDLNFCFDPGYGRYYMYLNSASPKLSNTPVSTNAAGGTANGTSITLNVVSQPAGGSIAYNAIEDATLFLTGVSTPGTYKFTLTIVTGWGTHTTPEITFVNQGNKPSPLNFVSATYPEQLQVYTEQYSGGEHHCNNVAGTTTPLNIGVRINDADPATSQITVISTGHIPGNVNPVIPTPTNTGTTRDRVITINAPSGGWQVGTYKFWLTTRPTPSSTCSILQSYYIHISDNARPNVTVNNVSVCYPGTGTVNATIALPTRYQNTVANPSYFQEFSGHYQFTNTQRPAGAAQPTYETTNVRSLTSTSTIISGLNQPGEYKFTIKAIPTVGGAANFLEREYACSGTSLEGTFSIFVTTQINANAGSDFIIGGVNTATLNGNDPAPVTGQWSVVSAPGGATPTFVNASLRNTQVNGLTAVGTYTFRWTITSSASCLSTDDVVVTRLADPLVIVANDDNYTSINGVTGNANVGNVLVNDLLNSNPASLTNVTISVLTPATPLISGAPVPVLDPLTGIVSVPAGTPGGTYTIIYRICENQNTTNCDPATITVQVNPTVSVSGNVWHDADGSLTQNGSETGTNAGGPLFVNVVDATNTVVASISVAADGSYSLTGVPANTTDLKLVLANTATATTPGTLPTNWVNTGENVGSGNTATQSATLGVIELTTGAGPITAQNFGIEALPTPGSGTATATNTGGSSPVTVPATAFTSTTPSTDTAPGSVTAIKITTFPTNVTSLTINGTTYTAGTFPAGGVTVPTTSTGEPTVPILVDPTNDSNPVSFSFTAIDNAGKESTSTGTATVNFSSVPDLSPVIYARPSTTYNTTPATVVVEVYELNNVATTDLITVKVSKDIKVNLSFTPGATSIGGQSVNNGAWSFDASSDPDYYTLTTNQVIAAGGVLSFGLSGTLTPGATSGTLTFTTVIAPNSGGEVLITNNADADKIDFFQK